MALHYTFNPALTTPLDQARQALQDIGEENDGGDEVWEFPDETYLTKLGAFPYREAVAQLASDLATKYSKMPDSYDEFNGVRITFKPLVKRFEAIAEEYRSVIQTVNSPQRTMGAIGQLGAGNRAARNLNVGRICDRRGYR